MKSFLKKISLWVGLACLFSPAWRASAFSLLGPVQPWMQETNGVIYNGDIGGPMCISNEYRWNVPVVTYGFDPSFINFFGTNGVAAVQGAFQMLNDLPPASTMVLTNYRDYTQFVNFAALVQSPPINDLRSRTLSLLLEQMGLASPMRNLYVLKQMDASLLTNGLYSNNWFPDDVPRFIVQRNYDPVTFEASPYIDGTLYVARISPDVGSQSIVAYPADPLAIIYPAVADAELQGNIYLGLTYDDVGGLAYLLSTNNVNYETLLPGVTGAGANLNSYVNGAWRPGVDKITFVPQPVDPQTGAFLSLTNQYTDTYLTNGNFIQQQLQRTTTQPDILFCAGDIQESWGPSGIQRTSTTNWINNAALNGHPGGGGPGVIQPGIRIVYGKSGRTFENSSPDLETTVYDVSSFWASFDTSTNPPVVYPVPLTGSVPMIFHLWLMFYSNGQQYRDSTEFSWVNTAPIGAATTFQTSIDLVNWTNLCSVTNDGSVANYLDYFPLSAQRFYRLLPPVSH